MSYIIKATGGVYRPKSDLYANMKVQRTRIKPLFSSFKNIIPIPRYSDLKISEFIVYFNNNLLFALLNNLQNVECVKK